MDRILVGTENGAFVLGRNNGHWTVDEQLFPGWKVTAFGSAPDGTHLLAVGSNWFGMGLHRSSDLETWAQIDNPPSWPPETGRKMEQIWTLDTVGDRIWAGVSEAGLFTSDDGGVSWEPVSALNEHSTRPDWQPGFGGLCAHRMLHDGDRSWVAISAVGVFRSDDGGASWVAKNNGVPAAGAADDAPPPEVGYCVHGVAHDPDNPDRIWRQEHVGVFRTEDGGDNWTRIENGLPAGFGFVMWRDRRTGRLLTIPLQSSQNRVPVDGALRVYRSDDDGDNWEVSGTGWPDTPRFTGVLRGAFGGDQEGAFCFGTTGGSLWLTEDNGDHWDELGPSVPRIGAVRLVG